MINVEKKCNKINEKGNSNKNSNILKIAEDYKKFYKENLKFKQLVITIIMTILFLIMLKYSMTKFENVDKNVLNKIVYSKSFINILTKDKIMISFIVILSGITPFVFFPIIGILYSCNLANQIGSIYVISKSLSVLIIGSIGAIIQIIGLSLSISTGILFCIKSTKRFIYNEKRGFGLKDVKKYIYKIRNNEKKMQEFEKKEQKRFKKNEKYNVKINYMNLVISFCISIVILTIGTLIVYFIK